MIRKLFAGLVPLTSLIAAAHAQEFGGEKAIPDHFADGQEFLEKITTIHDAGSAMFNAAWSTQDGAFRPGVNGFGQPLADGLSPLVDARSHNRLSGPDSTSCNGCHNVPLHGGGGDFANSVFVGAERFDFATFDGNDAIDLKGALDENGNPVTLQTIGDLRASIGLFGSGYIEMLARQITEDLQADRDALQAGQTASLVSERTGNLSFGSLSRDGGGNWDTSAVTGLSALSLKTTGPSDPPSLIVRPFHQAGTDVSLRDFTNHALNQHHGIESSEMFGLGLDGDDDGVVDEVTIADITVLSFYSAQYQVPQRVIPKKKAIEDQVKRGEFQFQAIGCTDCHVPALPLLDTVFTEPGPFNDSTVSLTLDDPYVATHGVFAHDLNDPKLDGPRLKEKNGVTMVPAFTDLKLHGITDPLKTWPADPDEEPLDLSATPPTAQPNAKFLTRKLWGCANEPPFFHHGRYSTMREAIEAHHGEAQAQADAWAALSDADRGSIIEFLRTLQAGDPENKALFVDENGKKRKWQAFAATSFAD